MDLFIIGVDQGQDFEVLNRNSRTDRSEWVRDFPKFSVLVQSGHTFLNFVQFVPNSGLLKSKARTRTEPLGPGRTGFGPWITCLEEDLEKMSGRFG